MSLLVYLVVYMPVGQQALGLPTSATLCPVLFGLLGSPPDTIVGVPCESPRP